MEAYQLLTLVLLIIAGSSVWGDHEESQGTSRVSPVDHVQIQTPLGIIMGIKMFDSVTQAAVYEFRGIRYGEAPLKNLRFRKPRPVKGWNGVYNASSFGCACRQPINNLLPEDQRLVTSEDCLFLNIYVPRVLKSDQNLTTMVWFHGGGFTTGYGNQYDGTRLAVDGNVIVVTLNYRLGILGFLSLNHPSSPGNYGLWDQKLALQWVHDNIWSFGGNPSSVTIFGQSAGALSVTYQSVVPSNKGLFLRGISESGVLSRTILLRNSSIEKLIKILPGKMNCSANDLYFFVHCLRNTSSEDLLKATDFWTYLPKDRISLETFVGPAVDGDFFPIHPILLLKNTSSEQSKFFSSIDFMTGTNRQEGSVLYMMITQSMQEVHHFNVSVGVPSEFVCNGIVQPYIDLYYDGNVNLRRKLCRFYTVNGSMDDQSRRAADCMMDIIFTPAVAEILDIHSNLGGKTFQYQFSKVSPKPIGPRAPSWFQGPGHGDELLYLFNVDSGGNTGIFDVKLPKNDAEVSKNMIQLWTTFAKTGFPTANNTCSKWLQYDWRNRHYLDIDTNCTVRQNLKGDTLKFWSENIPSPVLIASDVTSGTTVYCSLWIHGCVMIVISLFLIQIYQYFLQ